MEGNNNTTTVGGVTFGGGNQNPAPASPAGAAPTIENPSVGNEPVMASTSLNVDVVAPTHFDTEVKQNQQVQYQIETPNQPVPEPKPAAPVSPERTIRKYSTMATIFGVLAGIFLVLSIVGLVFGLNQTSELAQANDTIAQKDTIIKAVEESTGVSPIASPEDVPVYKATTGYIYIGDWNVKIKVPTELDKVSYYLDNNYREHICFNAVQKGIQYFPDFANIAKNTGRQGCLFRIKTSEGEFDAATGISFGTKVYTYKDYSFYYTAAVDYSKDAAELGLEHTANQIIKNMLTDNLEPYE